MLKPVRLAEIVEQLGGELRGDGARQVDRLGPLDTATPSTLGFVAQARYRAQIATTEAACIVVAPELADEAAARGAAIVTPDPYLYHARLTQWWAGASRPREAPGVHSSAVVEAGASVHRGASVGPLAFVGAGAEVGDGAVLGAQCHVGRGARVGSGSRLAPRALLGDRCMLGARSLLHPGAVIGADGFGFAPTEGRWEKIEQLGAVRIGDDVEIGANTCVDRGALDDTVVEDGVKLDNLIQIGHNVRIGRHTAMAGCVGVAGSTTIGAHCTFGGAAMVLGHLTIADHVDISAATVVSRSIRKPGLYSGFFPIDENAAWEKNAATLRHLHALRARLQALERKAR